MRKVRYDLDREKVLSLLKENGLSLRALGRDPNFHYTEKSITRAFKDGASIGLVHELCEALGVNFEDIRADPDNRIVVDGDGFKFQVKEIDGEWVTKLRISSDGDVNCNN